MASGITKPAHAYARFLKAWPAIVNECRAVWGSELHYQAMIYHALRTAGEVPREQLGMNVKIMIEDPCSEYFKECDESRHPDYRGGCEPIPDFAIFHRWVWGDFRRRNCDETFNNLLLAAEVKVSERADSRLQRGEIIRDIRKLDALRHEVREWESEIVPVILIIDTAETAEGRMTRSSLGRVREFAEELEVPLFYCGRYRCIAPDEAPTVLRSG
jgi:hypothetical protein